jgi:tRNA1Val (adenine37-N6)-methyltransferase
MGFIIMPDETLDDLHIDQLKIIQKKEAFRFGMDAVLLSSFVSVKKNQNVLDIGTGTGIIPILLAAKTQAKLIVGIEIQEEIASMARRSVEGNGLDDRIKIITGDIKDYSLKLNPATFDVVVTNPPYIRAQSGLTNPTEAKAVSRHEIACTLDDILINGAKSLKPKGLFYMIHRPERLTDILEGMRKVKIEPKLLRFICSWENQAPVLLLIKGLKDGNPGIKIMPDLVIYESQGNYTREVRDLYNMNITKKSQGEFLT